jgi:hypothetical protein
VVLWMCLWSLRCDLMILIYFDGLSCEMFKELLQVVFVLYNFGICVSTLRKLGIWS